MATHSQTFTAVFERDGDWWVGYVEELPGACTSSASKLVVALR